MSYAGDLRLGDTLDVGFTTVNSSGAPTALSGGSVAAYVGNSTTEITAGLTLSADFDGRTGYNQVRVVASSGNGYATATNVKLVLTAGTVGGTSVVGYIVGSFSIEARSALMPTTAARTLDVSATGEGGVDWANVGSPTTAQALSGTTISSAQVVASVTGAVGSVTGSVGSVTGNVGGNVVGSVASVTGAVGSVTGNVGGNVVGSVGSVAGNVSGNVVGSVGSVVGNVGGNVNGNVNGSVASVTGAVGSVTGNVGGNVVGSVGSVTGAVGSVTAPVTVGTNNDKTNYALSAAGVDAILDDPVDGAVTMRESLRLANSANGGIVSGAGTPAIVIRDLADTKNRVSAVVDADGNRLAVTRNLT